jgi:hypothetical protein
MRRAQRKPRRSFPKRQSRPRRAKSKNVAPRTKRELQARNRARHALARVRGGESLSSAARAEHTTPRTALKHVGKYLRRRRTKGGKTRYVPIKRDHLIRMWLLTPLGYVPVSVGSRNASLLGKHSAAVQKFLRTGDVSVLEPFVGRRVAGHELVTDPQVLLALARAGALRLDALYR